MLHHANPPYKAYFFASQMLSASAIFDPFGKLEIPGNPYVKLYDLLEKAGIILLPAHAVFT